MTSPLDAGQDSSSPGDSGAGTDDSGSIFPPRDAGGDSGVMPRDGGGDVNIDPGPPPEEWTCAEALWADGYCDCGCGAPDSDCVSNTCTELGCIADGCEACYTEEFAWKPCEIQLDPSEWTCSTEAQNDSLCDCGCTVPDDACGGSGCTEPGCWRGACDRRHGSDGDQISPSQPPLGWTCPSASWGNGTCDCGCGTDDPDCQSVFHCTTPLCNDLECLVCHDSTGRTVPCDNALQNWKCDPQRFGSGDGCDCGCGAADPDCAGDGCSEYGCRAGACQRCTDTGYSDDRLVGCGSAQWTCDLVHYGTGDGCDCGCGIADPDCGSGNGCTSAGCQNDKCDYCHTGSGETDYQICNGWTCGGPDDDAWKLDQCDCGCGKPDPRCRANDRLGCTASACQTATCQYCNTGGTRHECDGPTWSTEGTCSRRNYGLDGKCDCGCGAIDPDCGENEGCADAYCAADGCDVCHGAGSRLHTCYTWTCAPEAYNDGEKCDCGCGAIDPDCGGLGCAEPGCRGVDDACKPDGCHDPFGRQVTCP